jgi:hypothetical protein
MRILDCGNCRALETVEKRTACFSTVPTALGKLGKTAPSFPQFPQPLLLALKNKRRKNSVSLTLKANTNGHYEVKGVKNHLVPALPHWPVLK